MASAMIEKMMPLYDAIENTSIGVFRNSEGTTPYGLLIQMMDIPGMPIHCPPHHFIMPAVLLTCVAKETGMEEDDFLEKLATAKERSFDVLGGFCGLYGNCGAAVGVGMFMSVYTGTNPHSKRYWAACNRATAKALLAISEVEGPRCCKRNSFFALLSGIDTINEAFGLNLARPEKILCKYVDANPDCKKEECPFYSRPKIRTAIMVPERHRPENRDGKNCECMNRDYLLKYKEGVMHWLKKENDRVAAGEAVCEIEIEKKIFVVNAPADGILVERCIEEQAEFKCREVLGYIESNG